jgi:hypothetical protein
VVFTILPRGPRSSIRPLPSRCPADTFSSMTWTPWHFLIVAISGCMNREQQEVIG